VWIANVTSNSISELSPTGVPISPAAGFMGGGMNDPIALAIDPAGIVWIANEAGNSLVELSPTGRFLSGAAGFPGAGLSNPSAVAIDAGGDVWLPNQGNNRVTEFVGLATPVLTPMSACLARKTGHAVCLP
jgi:DNA-binding beta-propeller fold protein YncE